jgi:hypothetical protein
VVVAMTVVTTLVTPPVLGPSIRWEERRLRHIREHPGSNGDAHDEAEDGG